MNEFGTWDDFIATVNRKGYAFNNLLGQDRGALDLTRNGQITFPSSQIPSSNANTLDDYEEGTWTPTLKFNSVTTGITYTVRIGTYTKIGRTVHAHFAIQLSSKGAAAGNAVIDGLPAAASASNDFAGSIGYWGSMTTSFVTLVCYVGAGGTELTVFGATAAATAVTQLTDADYANGTLLKGAVTYHV